MHFAIVATNHSALQCQRLAWPRQSAEYTLSAISLLIVDVFDVQKLC